MKYTLENLNTIREHYLEKNQRKRDESMIRTNELHERFPEIREIDLALSQFGISLLDLSRKYKGDELKSKLDELKARNDGLKRKRNNILLSNGYHADYDKVKYDCEICSDTGYDGINMCGCMKKMLTEVNIKSSGIGSFADEKSFGSYALALYEDKDTVFNNKLVLDNLKAYAETFSSNSKNILLIGGTGIGKTHLSVSVGRLLIEKGFSVIFESAENIISDFEYEKYHRGFYSQSESKTDKYFECDLLIIDDLGAETVNQFSKACIYNLLNTRINRAMPMFITTNLNPQKLNDVYEDRITSRLFGDFSPLMLKGKDLRNKVRGKR
ncbi:MAG: ATP-binding protein [Firmicutes bacterium]|nr:ATP-binding protein [Candidatus Colimorpha enterica]